MGQNGYRNGRHARHWPGDFAGAEKQGLHGGGVLRRQRRSGGEVQGRNRRQRLQMGCGRLRGLQGRVLQKSKRRRGRRIFSSTTPALPVTACSTRCLREQWSEVIRADLDSVFNMSHQVFPGMRERGFGRIVNISSINGQKGPDGPDELFSGEGGHDRFHPCAGARRRLQGRHSERCCPGLYRHGNGVGDE